MSYQQYCGSCGNHNKNCSCFEESIKMTEKSEDSNKPLDKALKSVDIKQYEDAIELWKTHGGD